MNKIYKRSNAQKLQTQQTPKKSILSKRVILLPSFSVADLRPLVLDRTV